MKTLENLVSTLKLTPHHQPELLKKATQRALSKAVRNDPQIKSHLRPLVEILLQYCDTENSAERSLFNDNLNIVIVAFQNHYSLLARTLLDQISANGAPRVVTSSLQSLAYLINNVQPVELGLDPSKLVKALVEISRRSEDESVQRALLQVLKQLVPFLEYHIRKSKELLMLSKTLVELLLSNLRNECSQTRRLAASSIAVLATINPIIYQAIESKLVLQLKTLGESPEHVFVGLTLVVRELSNFSQEHRNELVEAIMNQLESSITNPTVIGAALETLKELSKFELDIIAVDRCAQLIVNKFLLVEHDCKVQIKDDVKVVVQANSLLCLSALIKLNPSILDQHEGILLFKDHPDTATRNQIVSIWGNYIEASWTFPRCVDQQKSCQQIRNFWLKLRSTLNDSSAHPDTHKTCIAAIKTCINILLESDHCTHILEHQDIILLTETFEKSNFKPLKVEALSLFGSLNFKALFYIERSHWSKLRNRIAGAFSGCLQNLILSKVINSLSDEHPRVRQAASEALVAIVPHLHMTSAHIHGLDHIANRSSDPIVCLAQDLSDEHLVLQQFQGHHTDDPNVKKCAQFFCIRSQYEVLSSSIVSPQEISHDDSKFTNPISEVKISMNLMFILKQLRQAAESSISKGKTTISSIVHAIYEISRVYPIFRYISAWDCVPSNTECGSYKLLMFLLSYLSNLTSPNVIVDDLEAYRNFLLLIHELIFGLCHESCLANPEPIEKVRANWHRLTIRDIHISQRLDQHFSHLTKLLSLLSYIIEVAPLTSPAQPPRQQSSRYISIESDQFFTRVFTKLEPSYRSSRTNPNQQDEKFHLILLTCLQGLASLMEFMNIEKSIDYLPLLYNLEVVSRISGSSTIVCARQMIKSLFGVNILVLRHDQETQVLPTNCKSNQPEYQVKSNPISTQMVHHHLIDNPYRILSNYYVANSSKAALTPDDESLTMMSFESRRAIQIRLAIERRVSFLFEDDILDLDLIAKKMSITLKSTIPKFTPLVKIFMNDFCSNGFCHYQIEMMHLMCYLVLLRVNYNELEYSNSFVNSMYTLLNRCGQKRYIHWKEGVLEFLKIMFTFMTLSTYDRGPSKATYHVAEVIQKLDDLRAELKIDPETCPEFQVCLIPPLRCLVEDLFIYRSVFPKPNRSSNIMNSFPLIELSAKKDGLALMDAERETIVEKLLDLLNDTRVYDFLSIIILEYRRDSDDLKYDKLCERLWSTLLEKLSNFEINFYDYQSIEKTRKIIAAISPKSYRPISLVIDTLFVPKPSDGSIQRWMSLVILATHTLVIEVKEDAFLGRLEEQMSKEDFIEHLLHIAQVCATEIISSTGGQLLLIQKLSSYLLYLELMFQSGTFSNFTKAGINLIENCNRILPQNSEKPLAQVSKHASDWQKGFNYEACERLFFELRLVHPDLTVKWCNIIMLLKGIDPNRSFWIDLLEYRCNNCLKKFKPDIHQSVEPEQQPRPLNKIYIKSLNNQGDIVDLEEPQGNIHQCLSPNIELARRGSMCLIVEDLGSEFVDVEFITKIINNHIVDIIRWSHEVHIAYFITAIHGNSSSSGIFIQAIQNSVNDLSSEAFVKRVKHTLKEVHYTQYGRLLILLVEKLLLSPQVMAYISLSREIEIFACDIANRLLNDTNKSLIPTKEELSNQLSPDYLYQLCCKLSPELYPSLYSLLKDLCSSTEAQMCLNIDSPTSFHDSDDDSDLDPLDSLELKSYRVNYISRRRHTACISLLIPSLDFIYHRLSDPSLFERVNNDIPLATSLIGAMFSLALNFVRSDSKLVKPKFWPLRTVSTDLVTELHQERPAELWLNLKEAIKSMQNKWSASDTILTRNSNHSKDTLIDSVQMACLKGLFLFENIKSLERKLYPSLPKIIIRLCRLPLINSFVLTPPKLWGRELWPHEASLRDEYKTKFPIVTHDILLRDLSNVNNFSDSAIDNFCRRILNIGWISRRQFEEISMTLLGILSATLSTNSDTIIDDLDIEEDISIRASCQVIDTLTELLASAKKSDMVDPTIASSSSSLSFDDKVIELAKNVGENLSSLMKLTRDIFEQMDLERKLDSSFSSPTNSSSATRSSSDKIIPDQNLTEFSLFLKTPAQKLRMKLAIDAQLGQQAAHTEDSKINPSASISREEPDVDSCVRLLLSVFKQKVKSPSMTKSNTSSSQNQSLLQTPPPLLTVICRSILTLSDLFTEFEQFQWVFDTFIELFDYAERNADELQLRYLVIGICKSISVCSYDIPSELVLNNDLHQHSNLSFVKAKESIERCLRKSSSIFSFEPLRLSALYGIFYMCEDSINIVASGAWELDHFRHLRECRREWIDRMMPKLVENAPLLTQRQNVIKLIQALYRTTCSP